MKLTRVAISVIMLTLATILFTTVEAHTALALEWIARIQIFPLALSGAGTAVALWLGCTLLFGRLYCSSICPMGTLQDIFSSFHRIRHRRNFHYVKPRNRLRYALLVAVAGCCITGIAMVPSLLDPYSAFGRIATSLPRQIAEWARGNETAAASLLASGIATATIVLTGWFSYRHGRIICNTVCPVGSALSIVSRHSLFHFDIDTDLCVNCRKCEHACKAGCINMDDHIVDGSRCVVCFNCVDACDNNAIRYTHRHKKLSIPMMQRVESAATAPCNTNPAAPTANGNNVMKINRRQFLATGLLVTTAPALMALGSTRRGAKPAHPVIPPGRRSMADFIDRCTGCGLCVAHCPAKVLRPSVNELGWIRMLHPVMDYNHAHCLFDCTLCTELCPTGALTPLTPEEKHSFTIGHARVEPAGCVGCGRCATQCPVNAITIAPRPDRAPGNSRRLAHIDTSRCIGCGACQHSCPIPGKAIIVDGIS